MGEASTKALVASMPAKADKMYCKRIAGCCFEVCWLLLCMCVLSGFGGRSSRREEYKYKLDPLDERVQRRKQGKLKECSCRREEKRECESKLDVAEPLRYLSLLR